MEDGESAAEETIYTNLPQSRSAKPAGYPVDTYTDPNDKVAKLRGDGQKIGPGLLLKVMAGDKFNLRVNSWYKLNGARLATCSSKHRMNLTALRSVLASQYYYVTCSRVYEPVLVCVFSATG